MMQVLDWTETSVKIAAGDTIYLYGSKPIGALTHECRVEQVGIPAARAIDTDAYWRDQDSQASARSSGTVMRLRLVRTFTDEQRAALSLEELCRSGLTGAPQGRRRVPAGVLALIGRVAV